MAAPKSTPTKGQQRQQEILAAARRLLVEEGYDAFALREVAARVGVTLGNLQYYYATRDDLVEAVIRGEFERNAAKVGELSLERHAPREKLAAIVRHLVGVWAQEGRPVYVALCMLSDRQPRFRTLHEEIDEAFYRSLSPVLAELRPRARPAELRRVARLLTTLVDGALLQRPGPNVVKDTVDAALAIAAA